jgi:hypothetical protein
VVIRVYSAHLTVAGEASLRSATHRERLPKSLTSPRCNLVRALLVGRGICESGEFRGTRQPGAFDPESSHLKIFHGFFETLSKRRGPCGGCRPRRTARRATCRLPHDAGDAKTRLKQRECLHGLAEARYQAPAFRHGRVVPKPQNSTSRPIRSHCQGEIELHANPHRIDAPKKLTVTSLNGAARHALIPRQYRTRPTTPPEKPHL